MDVLSKDIGGWDDQEVVGGGCSTCGVPDSLAAALHWATSAYARFRAFTLRYDDSFVQADGRNTSSVASMRRPVGSDPSDNVRRPSSKPTTLHFHASTQRNASKFEDLLTCMRYPYSDLKVPVCLRHFLPTRQTSHGSYLEA